MDVSTVRQQLLHFSSGNSDRVASSGTDLYKRAGFSSLLMKLVGLMVVTVLKSSVLYIRIFSIK